MGFGFYYMTYKYDPPKLRPVVAKYHDPDAVDPVGPSPVIIHKAQLRTVVEPYWQLCLTLKRDAAANQAFGWVLEMWAWSLATARLGIRHLVLRELQAEPANQGIHDLARYYIYHYTFDLKVGGWVQARTVEGAAHAAAQRRASSHTYIEVMNRAIAALPDRGAAIRGSNATGKYNKLLFIIRCSLIIPCAQMKSNRKFFRNSRAAVAHVLHNAHE